VTDEFVGIVVGLESDFLSVPRFHWVCWWFWSGWWFTWNNLEFGVLALGIVEEACIVVFFTGIVAYRFHLSGAWFFTWWFAFALSDDLQLRVLASHIVEHTFVVVCFAGVVAYRFHLSCAWFLTWLALLEFFSDGEFSR
jgi:hypothetical protein